jgi:hypothetical protein
MIGLILCLLSFVVCYQFARRSLALGMIALLVIGYFYGIVRANLLTPYSHFTFDAGLIGLYSARLWDRSKTIDSTLRLWVTLLIAWPMLVSLLPFQPIMVSIVGLRGNIFFLPLLLLASRLEHRDIVRIAAAMSVLNLVALGFAGAEYFTSVPQFYPYSSVTAIIYGSADVAGGFFRIPAIFSSAAAFGSAMVMTLPFLIGAWIRGETARGQLLCAVGIGAALLGILMSATRMNFILGCGAVFTTFAASRMKMGIRVLFVLLIAGIGYMAMTNARFGRFKSLDTDTVTERIAGSVNRGFWEILMEYPMGNGLGGGGTSIPYFLQGQVRNPIGLESEYARILCEQGVFGLLLWIAFIAWILSRAPKAFLKTPWQAGRRLAMCLCIVHFGTGLLGTGLLTSIPATMSFLLNLGWVLTPEKQVVTARNESPSHRAIWPERYGAAY